MELDFSLCLPRDEVSVPVVRHLCGFALRRLGVAEDCVDDIELAVTEACSNVLRHTAGTTDEYEVHVTIDECVCAIRVVDTGAGFDHESLSPDRVAPTAEGGRGIHLMRALVDHIRFVSKPESGTIVHLEKTLDCDEQSLLRRLAMARSGDGARPAPV